MHNEQLHFANVGKTLLSDVTPSTFQLIYQWEILHHETAVIKNSKTPAVCGQCLNFDLQPNKDEKTLVTINSWKPGRQEELYILELPTVCVTHS